MSRERERFEEIRESIKRESTDANRWAQITSMGRRHMLGPPGTLNTITPCAACKLLRRRCAQECPFSPYFSPHEPHKFASVHKVFGASNVSKMLMEVPECHRADAANSLVYEANVRLRDPVYGCMGAISALQQQVQALQAELNAVRTEILRYKYRDQPNINMNPSSHHDHDTDHRHHHALVISSAGAVVSVAAPPPLNAGLVVQSLSHTASTTTSSSMYTSQPMITSSAADFNTISSDQNVSYFC